MPKPEKEAADPEQDPGTVVPSNELANARQFTKGFQEMSQSNDLTNLRFGSDDTSNFLDKYKLNVMKGIGQAGVPTRGPGSISNV